MDEHFTIKNRLIASGKACFNFHRPGVLPDVYIFATPRGGSTWIAELICSQPGFRYCGEPLHLRRAAVRKYSGIDRWEKLYAKDSDARILDYFREISEGKLQFRSPAPGTRLYRPFTNRVVFKVIHGCEDRIDQIRKTFSAGIVLLLRHPIAVSVSRRECPRLESFIYSDYRRFFSNTQLEEAKKIFSKGEKLEKGVLSWCMQTAVPLWYKSADWVTCSYEQLVIEPEPVIENLADRLNLPDKDRMLSRLHIPSLTSEKEELSAMASKNSVTVQVARTLQRYSIGARRETRLRAYGSLPLKVSRLPPERLQNSSSAMVEKWKEKVSDSEERRLMDILSIFDLDVYTCGNFLPARKVWL